MSLKCPPNYLSNCPEIVPKMDLKNIPEIILQIFPAIVREIVPAIVPEISVWCKNLLVVLRSRDMT